MTQNKSLPFTLLLLRLGVFIVFVIWSVDKFIRPEHASGVFQTFYFSPAFGKNIAYTLGGLQLLLTVAFVLGVKKKLTYGMVFLLHAVSTLASYKQYLAPYQEINILFFAAWPMLASCYALYVLRDEDTLWTLGKKKPQI